MVDSFGNYGIIIKGKPSRGGDIKALCPACSSSRKKKWDRCLSVNVEKGVWNCKHCDYKGFLKDQNTGWKPQIVKEIREIKYEAPDSLSVKARKYLNERGITDEVIDRNQIKDGLHWMPAKEGKVNCLFFPFMKDGKVVNVKYRDGEKNFTQEKDAEKILYGYDDIDFEETIFVEGEMDKLALEVAGFRCVVSVPDGAPPVNTSNFSSKFDYLINCEDKISQVKEIFLALDNDPPGQKLEEELSRRLGRERCSRVRWPEGSKDANDVLMNLGPEALANCVFEATKYPLDGFIETSDEEMLHHFREGVKPGLNLGWPVFNQHYTVKTGQVTTVTGAPNSGKSEFLDAILINLAKIHNWKFCIFSPENLPVPNHRTKLIEKYMEKPADKNYPTHMSEEEYMSANRWVNEHFWFIDPEGGGNKLDEILDMTKKLIYRHGIQGLVIDPWAEIDHDFSSDSSETQYISRALSKIRSFSRDNEIKTWIVAHPKKLENPKKDPNKSDAQSIYIIATAYDIAGSAHWFNKSDNVLSVSRSNNLHDPVKVFIQKIRFKTDGQKGCCNFMYKKSTGVYTECREKEQSFILDENEGA